MAHHRETSPFDHVVHMHTKISSWAREQGISRWDLLQRKDLPQSLAESMKTWCGIQESAFVRRLKLAIVPEPLFELFREVRKKWLHYELLGMTAPSKPKRDEHGKLVRRLLPVNVFEEFVAKAGTDGLENFLENLNNMECQLKDHKDWAEKWARKRGILFLYFFVVDDIAKTHTHLYT